ncbi:MAG: NTP transferase domain-containing protein [Clostridiales bacterium]|jgi:broad specificity phosphatase PhoE/CTP:molybdopterin cytidylyltransferase MocA|nr:NTP transferase domain-containing protein [Clostridiales bacterium]
MIKRFHPSAAVLAAGYSSRMGTLKPLLPIGDHCALSHVLRTLKSAGINDTAVVTGYLREKLRPVITSEGATDVFNPDFDKGMLSSVKAGLNHFLHTGGVSGILLSPADCPLVLACTIRSILFEASENPDRFIVPCYKGKKGHPLWIPLSKFHEILSYDGSMGLKGITQKYDDEMIRLETQDEGTVLDMDTPEAYQKLLAYACRGANVGDFARLAKNRRFVLIRHGKTEQHKEKIFLGQYDPPLSGEGIVQANEAAFLLKSLSVKTDTIYSSDMKRAQTTAELIGKALDIPRICALPGLREMSLGAWDGKYISEIIKNYPEEYEKRGKNLLTYKFDNESENFYDLQYRVLDCVSEILQTDSRCDIVIVSHSGVIRALYGTLSGHDVEWGLSNLSPKHASITVFKEPFS